MIAQGGSQKERAQELLVGREAGLSVQALEQKDIGAAHAGKGPDLVLAVLKTALFDRKRQHTQKIGHRAGQLGTAGEREKSERHGSASASH